jgi:Spy/CpxP family protein refolding chaperone
MVVVSAALALGAACLAQETKSTQKAAGVAEPGGHGPHRPSALYRLPGFWMLGMENVQRELGLTGEQTQQLTKIADDHQRALRQDGEKVRRLSPEEQRKHWAQQRDRMNRQAAEVRKQVEQVLQPRQLEQYEEMVFRSRAAVMLANPKILVQLGVTDEQKAKLHKIRDEIQEKLSKVQQESIEKTLGALTAEQRAKLKDLSAKGQQF